MKHLYTVFLFSFFCVACSNDEKASVIVAEEVERGAVLRTLSFNNGEFEVGDANSIFSVNIEEQDLEEGALMQSITPYVTFIDNTPDNGNNSTTAIALEPILSSAFVQGVNGLPIITIEYTFQELLEATGLLIDHTSCKDQFRLDLDLNLTDGRTFNLSNSAGTIVNTTGFFKSPFSYLINIVEPIENDLFTGIYQYSSVQDGFFGPTFGPPRLINIVQGHSNNVRTFEIDVPGSTLLIEFSIVCDIAVIKRYQKMGIGCTLDQSNKILIGPDTLPAIVSSTDDTVIDLWFLEAFEGFDAQCDYENFPSKIRLSKQ